MACEPFLTMKQVAVTLILFKNVEKVKLRNNKIVIIP